MNRIMNKLKKWQKERIDNSWNRQLEIYVEKEV